MAAECPLAERRIVEIKMGRSKFPGKPSKIGNRKRVNLSSCALPQDNESSKAAENIYLGLSMFNEAFGDNEMIPPGPFQGFSAEDIEDALAEARLQQRESEAEYKKQGVIINLQDSFQTELTSIIGFYSCNENHDKNKTRLCFDGGGGDDEIIPVEDSSDFKPSVSSKVTSNLKDNNSVTLNQTKDKKSYINSNETILSKPVRTVNSTKKIFQLSRKSNSMRSLQSRAAMKLLQKAKMVNLTDINKSSVSERKFVLPTHSLHSLRVIKPNKRFMEDIDNRRERLLRAKIRGNTSRIASEKSSTTRESKVSDNLLNKELRVELTHDFRRKIPKDSSNVEIKVVGKDINDKVKSSSVLESTKPNLYYSSTGKSILREPKLQLNRINIVPTGGPFSASLRSSCMSPNSHLNSNPVQISTANKTINCGICGSVKFYKFIELAKKFGIYCCDSCQNFISKIIKSVESEKNFKLKCLKGKGLCLIPPIIKSQNGSSDVECQACWLKLCLRNFKMSDRLKNKLLEVLPADMLLSIKVDSSSVLARDEVNAFGICSSNAKDFTWLNQSDKRSVSGNIRNNNENYKDKKDVHTSDPPCETREISLRKGSRSKRFENKKKLLRHKGRVKSVFDGGNRQRIILKGPRVKNVCRSASVVLGQPIATFPREQSQKNQVSDSVIEINKTLDKIETTNGICSESQGVLILNKNKEIHLPEKKQIGVEKKSNMGLKQMNDVKPSPAQQTNTSRTKKKSNVKTENPISIDFWEPYDPEEICETGFGLIGSESFSVRALCFLCGSSGKEKLIHCASCCEPYHEFCVNEEQGKVQDDIWKYDWICSRCTICVTCGKTSGQQLKCIKCDNSYHTECVDRVGGRLLHSPDRPWVCSICLRCKSCNGVEVSVFVGNLPLCKPCFVLRQKGNYCPLCQRCYEDNDYNSKMMECGQCKCWVHAKCEGLSDEKYQVLSFLPESVEYICRMCCVMPPAPWWIAVEAELKSGYLGVLKALSKNRKACAMLKWSPRKQCTCRQVNITPRALEFEEGKSSKATVELSRNECLRKSDQDITPEEKLKSDNCKPASVHERKTSVEVINHTTDGSLKLTLKIMKDVTNNETLDTENSNNTEFDEKVKNVYEKFNIKECSVRVKKCPSNVENPRNGSQDENQDKNIDFNASSVELPDKSSLSSPFNPSSDSGIGSTDDELKTSSLTDEESSKLDEHQGNRFTDPKIIESSSSFYEDKNECICFLEVDSYNSRSKPFSPSLLSIKKKVTTSEYSSLQQFHMDMQRMIATTQSTELMEMYHQTVKEIFPWFDPKFSKVNSNSQKLSGTTSVESTPIKTTPTKSISTEDCKVPKDKLIGQPLEYYYNGYSVEDTRSCLMCKGIGDGPPNETGRLLYCGQNEWVHCNCALWSAEVFEEIDGSLQNVHSAINRGRSIRCPVCNMKGASIGCCARNCPDTFHFTCARKAGCAFMDDKTVFCPAHTNETKGKLVQNEKEFEIRRPVYVELDKKRMKSVDSSQVRFAVGGLHLENLGQFAMKLSDHPEAIIPDQFQCTRLFWSCNEPWKIVRYHFRVRIQEDEEVEGLDFGINLTVDHSIAPELLELKLKQLKYFQEHHKLLQVEEPVLEDQIKKKRSLVSKYEDDPKLKASDLKHIPSKRPKKDNKIIKKIVDLFDPREDESCLSDSQNTVDLIPPELEEAIFKDLPNDILDGISMQDIFMDIKTDLYDNSEKETRDIEDPLEDEEMVPSEQTKPKKTESSSGSSNQNDNWPVSDETKQNIYEWTDETCTKSNRDLKRSKSDVLPPRRNMTLRNNQRSCSLNWNCKLDIHTAKWKRNSKCHTAVNLLEPQERGNMLQELKFTDGLVMVSAESLTSVKDLKDRLVIQQEEGKENKCLPWSMKLQPKLLQVDGGVDSSSSGSEAGESPQRLAEENVVSTRSIPPPQSSHFSSAISHTASSSKSDFPYLASSYSLPQIDGVDDFSSDDSDYEYFKPVKLRNVHGNSDPLYFKISQLDGSADFENDGKINRGEGQSQSVVSNCVIEEPVKCSQCRCTYRTKMSYERHLESCSNDYILFSSDGEGSDEESPCPNTKIELDTEVTGEDVNNAIKNSSKLEEHFDKSTTEIKFEYSAKLKTEKIQKELTPVKPEVQTEPTPMNKEKAKRPPIRKKPVASVKKSPLLTNTQNVQQILLQQRVIPPAVIVQDLGQSNVLPGAYIDSGTAIQYVASLESQGAFNKPQLMATTNTIMPGGFHIQTPESQLISSLPILPQNVQTNLPGIIIQQPPVAGTLISSQPASVVMSADQMVMGAAPLVEVIHDPHTGGMFLASHNQPIFYNMETIVSNTVMQTNQYVSNVMTGSSFSQTSTQVVQTSKLEQIMNVPSNFILVGQNTTSDKIISSGDLFCMPAAQPLIQNQSSIQTVVNPILQPPQPFNTETKILPTSVNTNLRCIQPMQSKTSSTAPVLGKIATNQMVNRPLGVRPRVNSASYSNNVKQNGSTFKSMPMMRPNVTKSPPRQYEKAVIVPKIQKTESRAIVDYINNFKSDSCDVNLPVKAEPTPKLAETEKIVELKSVSNDDFIKNEGSNLNEKSTNEKKPSAPFVNVSTADNIEDEESDELKFKIPSPLPNINSSASQITPVDVPEEKDQEEDVVDVVTEVKHEIITETSEEPATQMPMEDEEMDDLNDQIDVKMDCSVEKTQEKDVQESCTTGAPPSVLPLQETTSSENNTRDILPKLPTTTKEMLQEKSKLFTSNQNYIATKLVTIHPRLIQSPEYEAESENQKSFSMNSKSDDKGPKLIFDVTSDDGFKSSSTSMVELWEKICDSVQEMRAVFRIPPLPISRKGHEILGMQNHGLQHCLEQLRGVEHCVKYKCKYFVKERSQKQDDRLTPIKENLSGCARTETYCDRKEYDMFAWLASRHRRLPKLCETSEEILPSARRANSLPMAMRYRHLRESAKTYVGVYRSKIHGKGLFCLREIEAGEMVIEYAGEVIRSNITDKREKYYTDKGIGCYMFRIDDHFVVDATMKGNAARFINHSCEPNCYSRVVDILGKKHIVIFALRRIRVMEELTYDYKFPFEDEKISCHCLSKKCRKYLN